VAGDNTVTFNFVIEENTVIDWDGDQFNPEVRVKMKLKGNRQNTNFGLTQTGQPAKFEMSMGEQSYIELPIDDDSWNEAFPEGGDIDGSESEDTPGFTLVVASAAIAMAVFVNARRDEE
ncbi:MAG: PGF-CTERM sorting domain-containing protein, partial [Candidatus Thermoplasmatota archaeon]|nr:PGF-CTERM sorting domain-containing protein [Candidatus Thermoplasmatota archaeon]